MLVENYSNSPQVGTVSLPGIFRRASAQQKEKIRRIVSAKSEHGKKSYSDRTKKSVLQSPSYLLGLLAMIKCSICSYQCEN